MHDGIERLLKGKEVVIKLKESAADAPIFLKAKPRGLGLTDEAMSSQALSEYLQRCCYDFGIISSSAQSRPTLYAWRRAAGTKVSRTYGLERTRVFMHHAPNSNSFQNAYDFGVEDLDVTGIALDEEKSVHDQLQEESAAAYRVEQAFVGREVFLRNYVLNDPDVMNATAELEKEESDENRLILKNAKRRARKHGEFAIDQIRRKLTEDEMDVDELRRRVKELRKPSRVMEEINTILKSLKERAEDVDIEEEEDYELADGESYDVEPRSDHPEDIPDSHEDQLLVFKILMETWVGGTTGVIEEEHKTKGRQYCPLCIADDTIQEENVFSYTIPSKFQRHLGSNVHTGRYHWLRKYSTTKLCPYGCGKEYVQ